MMHSVLIVEDGPRFLAAFTGAGLVQPICAWLVLSTTYRKGLFFLKQTVSDVLLISIGLPRGSGIELIRHANKYLPNCDVMFATVFGAFIKS